MIEEKIRADVETVSQKLLKELKMTGLVQADKAVIEKMDKHLLSVPVAYNRDGSFRKTASVATREQFEVLGKYVKKKIADVQQAILDGDASVSPYRLGKRTACTYCPYVSVCGFDRKTPGYEFRNLKPFSDEELWDAFTREVQ